ncbi:hypothetical protein GCM10009809_14350 [Isoptericola hypogeus]|uniref:DUF58 domain-containing protein n=1 Tax=Isoptericola hypogeus TaxID=300179 RepID=A0ABP4V7Z9_9MICO
MDPVHALVPAEHASDHLLVVPDAAGVPEIPGLALAWFDDAAWLRPPRAAAATGIVVGARFRGMRPRADGGAVPGTLRLGDAYRATGPFPVPEDAAHAFGLPGPAVAWALGRTDGTLDRRGARPASYDDRDGIGRAFPGGVPEGEELRVVRWAVAVARRAGGIVLADGGRLVRPDPSAAVDLALWTSSVLPPADLLAVVRSLVATARAVAEDGSAGPSGYRVVAATPYDGTTVADVVRAAGLPPALAGLEPAPGTVVYRVRWAPQDEYELQVEHPSGLHLIARARMRALHARLVLALQRRVGGTAVDDHGFVLPAEELERRTAEVSGARPWV